MIYPYISFSNNHFSNIFPLYLRSMKHLRFVKTRSCPRNYTRKSPSTTPSASNKICPRAGKCLHQIAYQPLIEQPATVLRLLNPTLCTGMRLSPTRDSAPSPTHGASPGCRAGCSRRNTSNSCRYSCPISDVTLLRAAKGRISTSPKEQRIVLNALRRVGVTEELRFDHYEESVNWYD